MGFWSKWFHKKNKEAEENNELNSEETSNQEEEKVNDGSNTDRTQYEKDVQSIAEEQEVAKADVEPQESTEDKSQKVN